MKFDTKTISILKNFASINPSIHFKSGSTLSTMSSSKTILARAKIAETIENPFAIYDLSRFLGTISLFQDPELIIKDKFMEIRENKKKLNYTFTEPSLIVTPPSKEIALPNPEVEFFISAAALQEIVKALSVLGLPDIVVHGENGEMTVRAQDSKNPSGDVYSVSVGETDHEFNMIIKAEYLKIIPGDYHVRISSQGLSHWATTDVEYYIAVEESSKFKG